MQRFGPVLLALALAAPAIPAAAQGRDDRIEGRVGRLESEMRAVQRRVFPNGPLVQPDIVPEQAAPAPPAGAPASQPLDDLTDRVSALETQSRALTGQVEQLQYRQRQMEEQFAAFRRDAEARAAALPIAGALPAGGDAADAPAPPVEQARPTSAPAPAAAPAAGGDRAARLAAVVRQDTGDAGEDAYMYGYRLWAAKLYPEAEAELKKAVSTYPKHRRASYAQNLLGRAYLDEGKPSLASIAFYDNYKKMPDGERAADSLFYLGRALQSLKKPADACKVYDELTDVYGAKLSTQRRAEIVRDRAAAKCK